MLPRFSCALSGGGFRAALFHAGVLRTLLRLGLKECISTISTVSGGSITGALFTLNSGQIRQLSDYDRLVLQPLLLLCKKKSSCIRFLNHMQRAGKMFFCALLNWLGLAEALPFAEYSCNSLFVRELDDLLYHRAKLSDLPDRIRLCINATNLNTGVRWRFTKDDFGDYKTGYAYNTGQIDLSAAVAASAGFPLLFSPYKICAKRHAFVHHHPPNLKPGINTNPPPVIHLTDGGIYDNLGIHGLRHHLDAHPQEFVVISDASGGFHPSHARFSYFSSLWRIVNILLEQVVSRDRQIIMDKLNGHGLQGIYFKLEQSAGYYKSMAHTRVLPDIGLPDHLAMLVRRISTSRTAFSPLEMCSLLYHGESLAELQIAAWHPALYRQLCSAPGYIPPAPDYDLP